MYNILVWSVWMYISTLILIVPFLSFGSEGFWRPYSQHPHPLLSSLPVGRCIRVKERTLHFLIRYLYWTEQSRRSSMVVMWNVRTLCSSPKSSIDLVDVGWQAVDVSIENNVVGQESTLVPLFHLSQMESKCPSLWTSEVGNSVLLFPWTER